MLRSIDGSLCVLRLGLTPRQEMPACTLGLADKGCRLCTCCHAVHHGCTAAFVLPPVTVPGTCYRHGRTQRGDTSKVENGNTFVFTFAVHLGPDRQKPSAFHVIFCCKVLCLCDKVNHGCVPLCCQATFHILGTYPACFMAVCKAA